MAFKKALVDVPIPMSGARVGGWVRTFDGSWVNLQRFDTVGRVEATGMWIAERYAIRTSEIQPVVEMTVILGDRIWAEQAGFATKLNRDVTERE